MNWNDVVCGVEVTPEMAVKEGWIIELPDGKWRIFGKGRCDNEVINEYKVEGGEIVTDGMSIDRHYWYYKHGKVTDCRPIMPPSLWQNKSDLELCEIAFGNNGIISMNEFISVHAFGWDNRLIAKINITALGKPDVDQFNTDWENALLLIRRLKGEES